MRISTNQIFTGNVNNLSRANAELFKTQQQISTGKKILQPSDDPLASAQIIKLKQEIAQNEQYQSNIEFSKRRLSLSEITLNQLFTDSVRLKELTIAAGNPGAGNEERAAIAAEVDEIISQMQGLMNTKDAQGEYLYSGFKGNTQAYTYDQATERYVFQGDSGRRSIQIGTDNQVVQTDSGAELFERVKGVSVPSLDPNASDLFSAVFVTNFDDFNRSVPMSFSLDEDSVLTVRNSDGSVVFNEEIAIGDRISVNGLELVVQDPLPTVLVDQTFDTNINATLERDNVLNVALDLRNGLKNFDSSSEDGKRQIDELLAKVLIALEGVQDTNMRARGSIGARINALESQEAVNEDYNLFTRTALSSFEDLDYNEAISRFTLQQTVLEAAYSSFNQIRNLSLFNYIS